MIQIDLEIPKCCDECKFVYDSCKCIITGSRIDWDKSDSERLLDCPLNKIAEPNIVPIAEVKFDDDVLHEIVEEAVKNIEIEPKWIPVSEPPKELGTYLIQTDGEPYMCQCRWTDVNPFWTDYKTKPHWNIFDLPQYSKVVAWMPLPTPYEPQESEDKE